MANVPMELGPCGERVARNVKWSRLDLGMELSDLQAALTAVGRPIGISSLSRIENLVRRVDANDLVGLAICLRTTPNWLLFGNPASGGVSNRAVQITSQRVEPEWDVWNWATGRDLLDAARPKEIYEFRRRNRPQEPAEFPLQLPPEVRKRPEFRELEEAYRVAAQKTTDLRLLDALMIELRKEFVDGPFDFDAWMALRDKEPGDA